MQAVTKTPEDARELALKSLEAMKGMPHVTFPLNFDNFGKLFVMDRQATLAMKEDSFKTFCITFFNVHYLKPGRQKQQQQSSPNDNRVYMFIHVGLIDIKGRTVVRDIGVFTDCGYSSISYEAVVAPTKKFSRSELKNEVFYHDASGRWHLRGGPGGRVLDAEPEDRVAEEIVTHARLALKKINREGVALVPVFLDATLVGHFDELLRRSKRSEEFYAICGSWVNLQEMALSSCSRKRVVFSAFENNAKLLSRLFFHSFHFATPNDASPATAMGKIHGRLRPRDGSAIIRAHPFVAPSCMSVCSIHCRFDEDTGCLLTVECSIRGEGAGSVNQDFNIPISPYGALADRTAEHRARLGFVWQGEGR